MPQSVKDGHEQLEDYFRFFVMHDSTIIGVIEESTNLAAKRSAMIVRDRSGRYGWSLTPRTRRPDVKATSDTQYVPEHQFTKRQRSGHGRKWIEASEDTENYQKDPLLKIIHHTSPQLTSWRTGTEEGNAGGESSDEAEDGMFHHLLHKQFKLEDLYQAHLDPPTRCTPALESEDDDISLKWQASRQVLTQTGLLSTANWGSLFPLKLSEELLRDLKDLDRIHNRDTFKVSSGVLN